MFFIHDDLVEEEFMKISPGFNEIIGPGKVCLLKKALNELKRSPMA